MKKLFIISFITLLTIVACSNQTESDPEIEEEVKGIHVDFQLPNDADTGETVGLTATVTYGEDELVTDAEEVSFEYWNVEDEENTTTIESTNNEDGTYTAEVVFENAGTYEIYAHTTAKDMHTMPKKTITIQGEENTEEEHSASNSNEEHSHQEDFMIHLEEHEKVNKDTKIDWTAHLKMGEEPYQNARVRYEIIPENSDQHIWLDTEEIEAGTYSSTHTFAETGQYKVVVHVNDDSGLHEHKEYNFEVIE
ncbi:hypothetical protein JCM21714_4205 [Gracilibacillus boraciitolerans JCM 21714]|uniref:YtkA-like domain-containing protein n=1 Tax=Gracilibacillus boraciitolerans JCM 21714 TaxID=1298598 RepID=W4VP75_9BACI|nr:FixH family protein [Gracilibacillus boraciitolerans]GAE95002.1 hypothetical protein JCM21714_4205 [Gracilibacillus boraciitolerans JCM 21714]